MQEIFEAIKKASLDVYEAIKEDDFGFSGTKNVSEDEQLKLDVKSDLIFEKEFLRIKSIKEIASEEKSEPLLVNENGKYLIGYDPLDGSSLVDVNLSIGSIFGIYENGYSGRNLLAAAYVVYGPRLEVVIASVKVERFVYKGGEFKFFEELALNSKGKINASGGTQKMWFPYHKKLIESFFQDGYRLRYSGGMVPDLHQVLIKKGGIFSYPGTKDKPKGKLRKIFEVFPFAYIFEKAGGFAIDNTGGRILEQGYSDLHDTTPCFFGSKQEIERVKEYYGKK
jgi:fructose-1,6-bisphosphatase I